MKDFSIKFSNVMVGIVLGLGFRSWTDLHEIWQYIAFVFIYLNLIDYWVDYSPLLKRYPFRREIDVILHFAIVFLMFYMVYSILGSVVQVLFAFALFRLLDIIWMQRIERAHKITPHDRKFFQSWTKYEFLEFIGALSLAIILGFVQWEPVVGLIIFVVLRLVMRILASATYSAVYYETAR